MEEEESERTGSEDTGSRERAERVMGGWVEGDGDEVVVEEEEKVWLDRVEKDEEKEVDGEVGKDGMEEEENMKVEEERG